jgi:hypothetical protein
MLVGLLAVFLTVLGAAIPSPAADTQALTLEDCQTLYMATVAARRGNGVLRAFYYHRLLQLGKAKKLAITACMRKLLTMLNAMVKNQQPWNPQVFTP